LQRICQLLGSVPAKVFDLAPLKGSLDPGADADFTLVDLDKERVLHAADFASYADYNLHEGWNLKGWPVRSISRGETVMDNHKLVGKGGHGKYLWRRIGQPPIPGKTR
jgi:dihydropyrimidinase